MIELDQAGRGLWEQWRRAPGEHSAAWLEYGWVQRHRTTPIAARRDWRIVPDTAGHVLIHRYPDRLTRPRIVGPRSRGVSVSLGLRRWTVGLRLRPGALVALLRDPAASWLDRGVDLDEVLPSRLRPRLAALRNGNDPETLLDGLTRLVHEAMDGRRPDWRVAAFERFAATPPVPSTPGRVATALGIAPRTLRAVLRRELGLSPRAALRIRRIQRAAGRMTAGPPCTLSRIAHLTGFADHAHLTREFGSLIGETPSAYLGRCGRDAGTFKTPARPPGERPPDC